METIDDFIQDKMQDPEFVRAREETKLEISGGSNVHEIVNAPNQKTVKALREAEKIARDPNARSYSVDEAFAKLAGK